MILAEIAVHPAEATNPPAVGVDEKGHGFTPAPGTGTGLANSQVSAMVRVIRQPLPLIRLASLAAFLGKPSKKQLRQLV